MSASLWYAIATVDVLNGYGIDTEGLRKSLTGEITTEEVEGEVVTHDSHKALIHMQQLTDEQFMAMRFDTDVQMLSYAATQELLATAEWASLENET